MTLRATSIRRAGTWPANEAADLIILDYDHRHRRRLAMACQHGLEILLDLPQATHLRDGDALVLETGDCIHVRARPELVLEIKAGSPQDLARLAWHLGNRHLAVQIRPGRLLILHDHVIARMIADLGGTTLEIMAAFDPESSASHHA